MIKYKYITFLFFSFFLAIAVFAIYSDLGTINKEITNIESVNAKLKKTLFLKNIIQELQRERGLTSIYAATIDKEKKAQAYKLVLIQRDKLKNSLILLNHTKLGDRISNIRKDIDKHIFTQEQIFQAYTSTILNTLKETKKLVLFTGDQNIKNHLIIYQDTNFIQEYLGELRAKIGGVFESKTLSSKQYLSIVELQTLFLSYIGQTKENVSLTQAKIKSPLKKQCFSRTTAIINEITTKKNIPANISAMQWFKLSTCAIDSIDASVRIYLQHVQNEINRKLSDIQTKFYYHIAFWLLTFVISIFLTLLLFRTHTQMLSKQKLLEDYKKAIDNSTIVSKTDKNGVITYVNKAFCQISGYKEKELLGKPHNIVRHPNVDKEVFMDLWKTLKSGKTWNGQIINLAKDKSEYWVEATISPIFDNENNLIEYIAIRHDITEIIELNKEIKNTQYELIYRMGESVESRSKESGHHIQRVAHYSKLLAQYYGLSNQESDVIFIASTMHDMGKIAIPDSILLKASKLDNEEWEIMKTHSAIGYNILAGSNLPILKMAADIAYGHHEHYNGNGYPRGIKGKDISIYARIVAIADVFDALISERVYKKAWSLEKTLDLFKSESGKQFDPELTQIFLAHIDEFMEIKTKFEG